MFNKAHNDPNWYQSGEVIIFIGFCYKLPLNTSANSKCQHPPPGQNRGEFFEVVKSPASVQNFLQKAQPRNKKAPTPGEYFEISSQPLMLIGVEILEFCRNQTLKRIKKLSNCSLVIPSSLSLSTTLYHSEVFPQF